jgi:regulator of sirC expression with transglutaminase-like and TPR domain
MRGLKETSGQIIMNRVEDQLKRRQKPFPKGAWNPGLKQLALLVGTVACTTALTLTFIAARFGNSLESPNKSTNKEAPAMTFAKGPRSLDDLLKLKPAGLDGVDVGLVNLLCAKGLSGSENLDVDAFVKRLDEMAEYVRSETARHIYKLREPEFRNSEGFFRMLYLVTVLQQDLRIHYNPARITAVGVFEPNEAFFRDSRDVFIHGLIETNRLMGTCASLPVFYLAVGRRLDYPLKLVATKNHLLIRWEDRQERFNIDATGVGLSVFDDDHYREWPFPVSAQEEKECGYLKSMTPAEELRVFLSLRGHCLMVMGKLDEAIAAHEAALRFAPDNTEQQLILTAAREEVALRRARLEFLPPEQLQRGAIPVGLDSREMQFAQALQFARQKQGGIAVRASGPQGIPSYAPTLPLDPNPLNQVHNPFKTP